MAATKYGHLLKKLNFQDHEYAKGARFTGSDLEGLELTLAWGYYNVIGEKDLGAERHAHPYGECLVFTGIDYDNPNHLGARLEIEMGEEGEKHVLDSPGVVIAPPGFPHASMVIRNADRPFGAMMIYLGGEYTHSSVPVERGQTPVGDKYGHLVRKIEIRDIHRKSGGNADFIGFWSGKDIEGFNLNFTMAFHTGLGAWHEKDPHVHPNDEALLFGGCDPENPEYLGAEIEIAMGEEREIHVFDTATVVVAPKGLVHCPLITRRVDRPYMFSAVSLNTEHETTWLGGEGEKSQ